MRADALQTLSAPLLAPESSAAAGALVPTPRAASVTHLPSTPSALPALAPGSARSASLVPTHAVVALTPRTPTASGGAHSLAAVTITVTPRAAASVTASSVQAPRGTARGSPTHVRTQSQPHPSTVPAPSSLITLPPPATTTPAYAAPHPPAAAAQRQFRHSATDGSAQIPLDPAYAGANSGGMCAGLRLRRHI
jgi:hypothetical protein